MKNRTETIFTVSIVAVGIAFGAFGFIAFLVVYFQ